MAVIALVCLISACNGISPDLAAGPTAETAELRLASGDKVRVTIYGEDKLSGEYQIDNAGAISLPLAGTLQAAGLTKPEIPRSPSTSPLIGPFTSWARFKNLASTNLEAA
jgi:polysaccharide export outer membrane protein